MALVQRFNIKCIIRLYLKGKGSTWTPFDAYCFDESHVRVLIWENKYLRISMCQFLKIYIIIPTIEDTTNQYCLLSVMYKNNKKVDIKFSAPGAFLE
jgi:hypothetical protein